MPCWDSFVINRNLEEQKSAKCEIFYIECHNFAALESIRLYHIET